MISKNNMGRLYVFSAPSGAGKSTIINNLEMGMDSIAYSVSHTSRKPRGSEEEGVHYHFVEKDTFSRMIVDGQFVEWAEVYGNLYGTSFSSLDEQTAQGLDVLLDLDHQGAKNIRQHYEDSVLIYVLPPSLEVLEGRLRGRGTDDEKVMKKRLDEAVNEMKNCVWYNYIIINDDLEKAQEEAQAIVLSQRCRTSRQAPKITDLFGFSF
jgi:guanylate kinase